MVDEIETDALRTLLRDILAAEDVTWKTAIRAAGFRCVVRYRLAVVAQEVTCYDERARKLALMLLTLGYPQNEDLRPAGRRAMVGGVRVNADLFVDYWRERPRRPMVLAFELDNWFAAGLAQPGSGGIELLEPGRACLARWSAGDFADSDVHLLGEVPT